MSYPYYPDQDRWLEAMDYEMNADADYRRELAAEHVDHFLEDEIESELVAMEEAAAEGVGSDGDEWEDIPY